MYTVTIFCDHYLIEHWRIFSLLLGLLTCLYLSFQSTKALISANSAGLIAGMGIAVLVALWIGSRPPYLYGDSLLYYQMFSMVQTGEWLTLKNSPSEWLWTTIEMFFIHNGNITDWYIFIAIIYVLGLAIAISILTPKNFLIPLVFCLTAFSFFSYGTNGLRNGMATSVAMIGLALLARGLPVKNTIQLILGYCFLYLSTAIHTSLTLILACSILAVFFRNTKVYLIGWFLCIIISLFATGMMVSLFSSIIDDGRMSGYGNGEVSTSMFARSGFRWDFILYSAIPIVLGYYALYHKHIKDTVYIFLLNIYIIANAFWCSINSVSYSNRFAYLSWFMLPILVAYPLVKFQLFKKQGLVAGGFMLFFTIFNLLF